MKTLTPNHRREVRRSGLGLPLLTVLGLMLAGCPGQNDHNVYIAALTNAPPARTANINNYNDDHSIKISRGAALAIYCYDSCDYGCIAPEFIIADPSLLEVRETYYPGASGGGFVLFGKKAGATTLRVRTTCADQLYLVQVVAGE